MFLTVTSLILGMVVYIVSQTSPSGGNGQGLDITTILVSYGVAAPFVAYLLLDNRRKDSRNEELQKRNETLTDTAIDKFAPLTVEATSALREAGQELRAVSAERDRLASVASARTDPEIVRRLLAALERSETDAKGGNI